MAGEPHPIDDAMLAHSRRIAHAIVRRSGDSSLMAHLDDMESAALVGLVEASRSYRSDGGASFKTFASARVAGAVRDEIRKVRGGGFAAMSCRVRRGEIGSALPLDAPIVGRGRRDLTVADLIDSGELPVGWEAESEDEVRSACRMLGRRGEAVADYLLRADRSTMRLAGEAHGISESRLSQVWNEAVGRFKARGGIGGRAMLTLASMGATEEPEGELMSIGSLNGHAAHAPANRVGGRCDEHGDYLGKSCVKCRMEKMRAAKAARAAERAERGEHAPPMVRPKAPPAEATAVPATAATPASPPASPGAAPGLEALAAELAAAQAVASALAPLGGAARRRVLGLVLASLGGP